MPNIAYQLYCSRNFPPLSDTLKMLSAVGYQSVEGYGGILDDVDGLRRMLDDSGLTMTSCHMGLDAVEGDTAAAIATARKLGMNAVFVPFLQAADRPVDSAGWSAFGKRLATAGKPFQDAGLTFGWHNHDFEFQPTPQGDMPLDLIAQADDTLMLELDLGWVRVAGLDPVEWINKYAGRIAAAHIKDIAPDGENAGEDGWADVGHGIMNWPAIHVALQLAGVRNYVVEHDNPKDDARFASRSLTAITSF